MSNPYPDYKSNTITTPNASAYSFQKPPSNIIFFNNLEDKQVEVLRISKEGVTANPNVPVDEAADAVIRALDGHIKNLVHRPWVEVEQVKWEGDKLLAKLKEKND